jgi:hypothetical protein
MAVKRSTARGQAQDIKRETESPSVDSAPTKIIDLPRDEVWQAYCKIVFGVSEQERVAFEQALVNGKPSMITRPAMMTAALRLTGGMAAAGVRRWDFLPPPSDDELADTTAWAAQRLTSRRAEQDAADLLRRLNQKAARALGLAQPGSGTGTISPVHLQRLKYSLDQLADRLERAMSRPGFEREWLDHRSRNYVRVSNGGISNKQVAIMAGEITGRRERRTFEENWKVVTDWLHQRRMEEPTRPEPNQA